MYRKRIGVIIIVGLLVLCVGVMGYMIIERWSFIEALYMTVITLTTVGFGEVRPLSNTGRVFTTALILLGMGTVAYSATVAAEFIGEGELVRMLRRRKMKKEIEALWEHYIVCGYGRIGSQVCDIFRRRKVPFVVVESDPQVIEELRTQKIPVVEGNAHENEVLKLAGIERAKALVTAVASDAENVFVTLTAKGLNPNIAIASRMNDIQSEEKFRRAGADFVISPYIMGARRMAMSVLKPSLVDFLDGAVGTGELGVDFDEILVDETSPFVDKTLVEAKIAQDFQTSILLIRKQEGKVIPTPGAGNRIGAGDLLIVTGPREQLERFRQMAGGI